MNEQNLTPAQIEANEKERVRELTADYLSALKGGIAERERLIDNLSLLTEKSEARIDATNKMIGKLTDVLDRISDEYVNQIESITGKLDISHKQVTKLSEAFDSISKTVTQLSDALAHERARNERIEKAFIELVQRVAHPAINNHVTTRQVNVPKDYNDSDL